MENKMRHPLHTRSSRRLALALAATGLAFAAAPALAQTVDEVTVVGHLAPDGRPDTISRAVDISDLDLRYDTDVREMQSRVRYTARALCEELGETGGPGLTPSCVDAAVRGAQRQTRFAVAQARAPVYYAYREAPPRYAAPPYAPPPYADDYDAPPASAVVPDYPPEL
jgi:UrcA family protein